MTTKTPFQFRFEPGKWQDLELSAANLNEIAFAVTSTVGARYPAQTFPELYQMILANHNATKELDPRMIDIADLILNIRSNEDDVLKVEYQFSVRYGTKDETEIAIKARALYNRRSEAKKKDVTVYPQHEPRPVRGLFTIMPGV